EEQSGRRWIYAPSTFRDNPHLDQAQYQAQLRAACPTDPELLRAWLDGDWAVARGAFFAGVLEESRNAFGPWTPESFNNLQAGPSERLRPWQQRQLAKQRQGADTWQLSLAHDFGSAAPSVTYVVARSPGAT